MKDIIQRSIIEKTMDSLLFPIRALFMVDDSKCGLTSLREERMRTVAKYCKGKVLDIGCGPGNLFINKFIGSEDGIGIDIYPYKGVGMIVDDMTKLPFDDCTFDTVTLIAVGGHIPKSKRHAEFQEFARILKKGGILVMTEGEPITQYLVHVWVHCLSRLQGTLDVDSERGMEEDEEYCMPREELISHLNTPPLKFVQRGRFMWGLNNIYTAEKINISTYPNL